MYRIVKCSVVFGVFCLCCTVLVDLICASAEITPKYSIFNINCVKKHYDIMKFLKPLI